MAFKKRTGGGRGFNPLAGLFDVDPVLILIGMAVALAFSAFQLYSMGKENKKQRRRIAKEERQREAEARARDHHSKEFGDGEKIVSIDDGDILVAVGFGSSNCSLIKGTDGCVAVGALDSPNSARRALSALKPHIENLPVKALVLTHYAMDVCGGAEVFTDAGVPVFAHGMFEKCQDELTDVRLRANWVRRLNQESGVDLADREIIGGSVGRRARLYEETLPAKIHPTKTFRDRLPCQLAGLNLELIHCPGETDDHLSVWWPDKRALFCGDNVRKCFPNFAPLSGGASTRDCMLRVKALEEMRALQPKILVPAHARPLVHADEADDVLRSHRDAVKYVHDQTVRFMNKGRHPDDIVHEVTLPERLFSHPYLQELGGGTVEWAVRCVFEHYMGWFSGDPVDLHPLPPDVKAGKMVAMCEGEGRMLEKAREAYEQFEVGWAVELCEYLVRNNPDLVAAKELMSLSLRRMASREESSSGRNWLLSRAKDLEEEEVVEKAASGSNQLRRDEGQARVLKGASSPRDVLKLMSVSLAVERMEVQEGANGPTRVKVNFRDSKEEIEFEIRHGIVYYSGKHFVSSASSALEFSVASLETFKQLVRADRTPEALAKSGDVAMGANCTAKRLKRLVQCFDM